MIMIAMLSEVQKTFQKASNAASERELAKLHLQQRSKLAFNCLAMTRMAVVLVLVKVAVRVMLVMVSGWMNGWVMQ